MPCVILRKQIMSVLNAKKTLPDKVDIMGDRAVCVLTVAALAGGGAAALTGGRHQLDGGDSDSDEYQHCVHVSLT